jgi:hypothetical protein
VSIGDFATGEMPGALKLATQGHARVLGFETHTKKIAYGYNWAVYWIVAGNAK